MSRTKQAFQNGIADNARGLVKQPKSDNHFAAMPYPDVPEFVAKISETESVGRLALRTVEIARYD